MRLLLDENISPALVGLLGEIDVYAQSVPHVGLGGRADRVVWQYALDHDFAVVTANAQDFIELLDMPVHPGLIVLRESGLSRQEQWERVRPVVEHVCGTGHHTLRQRVNPTVPAASRMHRPWTGRSLFEDSHSNRLR